MEEEIFNPAEAAKNIKEDFVDYILSTRYCYSEEIQAKLKKELLATIAKGPFVSITDLFKEGATLKDLEKESKPIYRLSSEFEKLEQGKEKKKLLLDRPLYLHQEKAYRKVCEGRNIVVTTGTGSGKTESFLIPIFNELLKEKEKGTLDNNVRAILIYPMNALANDQIKRLRQYLLKYPDITFGIYTGETKEKHDDALGIYEDLHANDIDELKEPLPNERISREEMKETPPHILITNYSMLDYMMLRPEDNMLFTGKKLRFVVLDEAHTYRGAQGIETALLLSRLKARVIATQKIQFILTSATLGEKGKSEKEIVDFAKNLTGENFETEDIIFSERVIPDFSKTAMIYVPIDLFETLFVKKFENIKSIFQKYGIPYDEKEDDPANIYNLCFQSSFYRIIRKNYRYPEKVSTISQWLSISDDQTIAFLSACSYAEKDGKKLLDLRYHFFLRALEGGYISLSGDKRVSLVRKEFIKDSNENEHRMFEFSVCNRCGDIALVGAIETDEDTGKQYLKSNNPLSPLDGHRAWQYFHIVREGTDDADKNLGNVDNDDQENGDENSEQEDYWLCPECGQIAKGAKPLCQHNPGSFVHLRTQKNGNDKDKCLFCFKGDYQRFNLGQEGPTAILATSLFEELPTKEKIKHNGGEDYVTFQGGKQFLMFSDSRGEAAFFACYLEDTTKRLMARRGFIRMLEQRKNDIIEDGMDAEEAIDYLTRLFVRERTFASSLSQSKADINLKEESFQRAAMTVMVQLTTARRPASLQSMGFLKYQYRGVTNGLAKYYQQQYFPALDVERVYDLLNELAMHFGYNGAFRLRDDNDERLILESRKQIFNTEKQKAFIRQKTGGEQQTVFGWLPRNKPGKRDEWYPSLRQSMVMKAMNSTNGFKANEFLADYWSYLENKKPGFHNEYPLERNGSERIMPFENFEIKIKGCEGTHWYRCSNCGQVTTSHAFDDCPIEKCHGKLHEVADFEKLYDGNHYYSFYTQKKSLKACIVKEHTAQLTRKIGQEYQREFEQNEINALSCSTTFELGVDVGDLETVFLRDVPPTPANYAQRAGRAGRSKDASAFVMTYAKLSSHDFHFFEQPLDMIEGKIYPPSFTLENPKILYRHIYSVVLGYLVRLHPEYYSKNNGRIFIQEGYQVLKDMLLKGIKGDKLSELLKASFSCRLDEEFAISDYGKSWKFEEGKDWVSSLIGDNGNLEIAVSDYLAELKGYDDLIEFYKKQDETAIKNNIAPPMLWKKIEGRKSHYETPDLIGFLVSANVLPKFGFPVDVVSLRQKKDDGDFSGDELNLTRDMSQAIGDYAPGVKVIADGCMYTPRYIRKISRGGQYDFDCGYIQECPYCKTLNYLSIEPPKDTKCIGCGEDLPDKWTEAIQPTNGLYTDGTIEDVPLEKPKKLYHSNANYVGKDVVYHAYKFSVGQNQILVYSSERDKIAVTSELDSPFYVCDKCGYAIGKYDSAMDENFKIDKKETEKLHFGKYKTISCYHKETDGGKCSNHLLKKRHLIHEFNTDIIQILFVQKYIFRDESTILSVLTALLDATSRVLHIERNDISGCVRFNSGEENTDTRFILFDNVAGGAGHVKRILEGNGEILRLIIANAYDYLSKCNCDPSCYKCLRSYENQEFHDKLNRFKAIDFFKNYIGMPFLPLKPEEEQKPTIDLGEANFKDFKSIADAFEYDSRTSVRIHDFNDAEYPIPDGFYIPLNGFPDSYILFAWKKEKVLLIDKSYLKDESNKILDCDHTWTKIDITEEGWSDKLKSALAYRG